MKELIQAIQEGHPEQLEPLLDKFKPLIYHWLKKMKKLHTVEQEDYYSLAKITLLECALSYDETKKVPFQSYYKIKLWHKGGSIIHKKQPVCISLEIHNETLKNYTLEYEKEEQRQELQLASTLLKAADQDLLHKILQGYKAEEIAQMYGVKKKTIINRKSMLIKKIKAIIQEERAAAGEKE